MNQLTEGDKKLLSDIKDYGWHVLHITEDETGPAFSYSVGLFKTFNHPEIIIIGLKQDLAHILINNIGEDIKNGKDFHQNKFHSDILDDFDCYMVKVDQSHYSNYLGYAQWYYKNSDFPISQCVYPTVNGVYPWEENWPDNLKDLQPILGTI